MVTKEYRIFEQDKYGNKWFQTSFSGNPEIQRMNAEKYVRDNETEEMRLVIEEVG